MGENTGGEGGSSMGGGSMDAMRGRAEGAAGGCQEKVGHDCAMLT
jgi:hypothetical protein